MDDRPDKQEGVARRRPAQDSDSISLESYVKYYKPNYGADFSKRQS